MHKRNLERSPYTMPIPTPAQRDTILTVAISGGGPAGLAAAIALLAIPGVQVTIYEQARALREIGAGLRVGFNSWRVLELLGVDQQVHGHKKVVHEHR
jgi:salicylate hydroxylase